MDAETFNYWLEYRLFPAFEAAFPGKNMVLVLDNAPYHRSHSGGGGVPIKYLNKNKYDPKHKDPNKRVYSLVSLAAPSNFDIEELEIVGVRGKPNAGEKRKVVRDKFPLPTAAGGCTADELRAALTLWFRKNRPEVLMNDVYRLFKRLMPGSLIIYTPPYSPKFVPIELLWCSLKAHAAYENRTGRTIEQTYEDLADYCFGTKPMGLTRGPTRPRVMHPFISKAAGKFATAEGEMAAWIGRHGVRCSLGGGDCTSGECMGDPLCFKYDGTVPYAGGYDPDTIEDGSYRGVDEDDDEGDADALQ